MDRGEQFIVLVWGGEVRGLILMRPINRISDLRDPNDPQGRTYREVNAAKAHKYPIGALVEFNHGIRLWVVYHARDCDQTPLYCLSADPNDTEIEREGFYNATWVKGIAEQYLTLIRMVNAPESGDERLEDIRRRSREAHDPQMGYAFTKRPSWNDVNYLLSKIGGSESNRNKPCTKVGQHQWIGDDAGDSWCEKCGEPLLG